MATNFENCQTTWLTWVTQQTSHNSVCHDNEKLEFSTKSLLFACYTNMFEIIARNYGFMQG